MRVHRSHIVNLERVVGLKRSGDNGLIELAGHDPYMVPVSRSRFGGLKSQLGLGPREAIPDQLSHCNNCFGPASKAESQKPT